jgi:dihydrofolate reductase
MIRIIVAIDQKRGIAKDGVQPWDLPDDVAYFNAQTKSQSANILVGRTTFSLFDEPLVGRTNYVLTRQNTPIAGATTVHDLEGFLQDIDDVWVIGGAAIYEQVMTKGLADELYITHIEADFGCDAFFPEYDQTYVLRERSETHKQNGVEFSYAVYLKA